MNKIPDRTFAVVEPLAAGMVSPARDDRKQRLDPGP